MENNLGDNNAAIAYFSMCVGIIILEKISHSLTIGQIRMIKILD